MIVQSLAFNKLKRIIRDEMKGTTNQSIRMSLLPIREGQYIPLESLDLNWYSKTLNSTETKNLDSL